MKKIVLSLTVLSLLFLVGSYLAKAQEAPKEPTAAETSQAINVGNKICPVSDEKINEKTKATYEYEGKIYNLCCPMCIDEFKKDPEKYIKKVEEELKTEPESKVTTGSMPEHSMPKEHNQ